MTMGPGLYSEIGKKARDLLYKDYQTDQKFTLTTCTPNGFAITASGTKKSDLIFGEIQTQLKNKYVTVDVKANSDSSLLTTVTANDVATPGLKTICSFVVPDQKSGKAELQYLHDYAGVNAAIGLTRNPLLNLSGVIGTNTFATGVDVAFDTATGNFTKYNSAVSFTNVDLIASIALNNNGDSLTASYYHLINPLLSTAVGGEITHSFSSNENTMTFGTQHALDPQTIVKARINNYGKASALIQHEWRPKSLITLSGEVDTKSIEKGSKVGLSLVLKP
ncbi:mitochondrial outer membrane porin-like [Dioscorea cayenensis subsp. rotundata]|uniref:Mitochondrial outer membrane porin-like n=1 Tax=Dioscorea cayennensis subsp. rotundata TaxID=55577 RepID=A0AB40AUI4_DIOCR|nr:mitochondrial outer membrane porin-like [Dioscorea cayenensis subsp. rotundata]